MKKSLFSVIALAALLLFITTTSHAITIGFDPVSQDVPVGDTVAVELFILDLENYSPDSLSTFDLDISFDSAILAFHSVVFGDPVLGDQLDLWGLGSWTEVTHGVGTVNLYELSFDSADDLNTFQVGSFTLATLTFDTLAVGTSSLDITLGAWGLGDANGNALTVDQIQSGSISPVPEPATMLLVGSGMAGIFGLRRKRWFKS